jgi:hypothetical protein
MNGTLLTLKRSVFRSFVFPPADRCDIITLKSDKEWQSASIVGEGSPMRLEMVLPEAGGDGER